MTKIRETPLGNSLLPIATNLCSIGLLTCVLSWAQLFVITWTVVHQAPTAVGFPRLEYWSVLPVLLKPSLPKLHIPAQTPGPAEAPLGPSFSSPVDRDSAEAGPILMLLATLPPLAHCSPQPSGSCLPFYRQKLRLRKLR